MKELFVFFANVAKVNPKDIGYEGFIKSASSSTLATVLNAIYLIAGVVGVLVIVIAGYKFVTSQGDANQVAAAKKAILGAVIGLVIVMIAFTVTQYLIGVLQ